MKKQEQRGGGVLVFEAFHTMMNEEEKTFQKIDDNSA